MERPAPLKEAAKRLVEEATVLKKLVEVELDEVELRAVKFWRVVEPITKRSPEELMVVVAVWPTRRVLALRNEAKRLVEVA